MIDSTYREIKMTDSQVEQKLWQPLQLYDDCIELRVYTSVEDHSLD